MILAHPLYLQLLSSKACDVTVLHDLMYRNIDGELVGVARDSWILKNHMVSVTWNSITVRGIKEECH